MAGGPPVLFGDVATIGTLCCILSHLCPSHFLSFLLAAKKINPSSLSLSLSINTENLFVLSASNTLSREGIIREA